MIIIDTREHDMIRYCQEQKIDIETRSLEVGDIHLQTETDHLIFERKTISDLAASIKDGRFREQKQRLSLFPHHRITYMIEGMRVESLRGSSLFGIQNSALLSAMISLSFRDGFHIIHTSSMIETMLYLLEIHSRMVEHPEKVQFVPKDPTESSYVSSLKVKTKKIDNITPSVCFSLQLSQIPGISTTLAGDIMKSYPTLVSLLSALQEKGVKAFINVPGIGDKKAKRIVEYLLV
jgi:crossover junction endonuclease MUS81